MNIEFNGKIWFWKGPAPWYFVTVPAVPSDDIKAISAAVTEGNVLRADSALLILKPKLLLTLKLPVRCQRVEYKFGKLKNAKYRTRNK